MLELTRTRAEAGLAAELDVERQSAQLASTEAAIPPLRSALAQTVNRLSVLLGARTGAIAAHLAQPPPPEAVQFIVPVGLPSDLLRRRPDIRQAELEIAAAMARAGSARRDRFPRIVLSGLVGKQATSFSGLTLGAGNFFGVGPSVQLPILNGGRIRSNIAARDAKREQSSRRYEQVVLAALQEVENALVAYRREHERRQKLNTAVSATRNAAALARELYVAGVADFLSVLDAERTQHTAEDDLVQSETTLRTNLIFVYKALGK